VKSTLEMPRQITVAITDGGGRGHAFANASNKSMRARKILCFKGGDGWGEHNGPFTSIQCFPDIDAGEVDKIIAESLKQNVDLLIAGQEIFLANGGADKARSAGIKVVGCSTEAARLETSKVWAKKFFKKYRVPTADYDVAFNLHSASLIVDYWFGIKKVEALVLKAEGLAEGKGVIIAHNIGEAHMAVLELMGEDSTFRKTYTNASLPIKP